MDDPDNLQRFVDAQQHVYGAGPAELRAGRKTGHWIWFILPLPDETTLRLLTRS